MLPPFSNAFATSLLPISLLLLAARTLHAVYGRTEKKMEPELSAGYARRSHTTRGYDGTQRLARGNIALDSPPPFPRVLRFCTRPRREIEDEKRGGGDKRETRNTQRLYTARSFFKLRLVRQKVHRNVFHTFGFVFM